jgi:ubiquinone/menaquinone biosynthesis C-methylase UbiE
MSDLKEIVKEKYSIIAEQSCDENSSCCCGANTFDTADYTVFADDYSQLAGYNKDADLGLGCGLPTQFALIKPGDVIVDLGSGAGNDCFVARAETGETGRVIGIDFTETMLEKARANTEKLGFTNVEFIYGDIENIPLPDNTADVVVSNCVLNLVPDKVKAFSETFRILKSGGHFSISDVVIEGEMPEGLKNDAVMYAGCVSGAIQKNEYLGIVEKSGFTNITLQKQKPVLLPKTMLLKYLKEEDVDNFYENTGIFSITVYAEKP